MEIILDCDPRKVNDKGVEQSVDGGEKKPAAPTKPKARGTVKGTVEVYSARQWDSPTRIYQS